MKDAKFEDLFSEALEDLHRSEGQMIKTLPKMVAAASSQDLTQAFQEHMDQAGEHVRRLESVFEAMGAEPGGKPSNAMTALLADGDR
jgi:ferritin-like metal-binding protein YciE